MTCMRFFYLNKYKNDKMVSETQKNKIKSLNMLWFL